jgi:hypothetical protein
MNCELIIASKIIDKNDDREPSSGSVRLAGMWRNAGGVKIAPALPDVVSP